MSHRQIALALGLSRATVRDRLEAARRKLMLDPGQLAR